MSGLKYIFQRVILLVGVFVLVLSVTFILAYNLPGAPYPKELEKNPTMKAMLVEKYGLEDPLGEKYITFWKNISQGDLGYSLSKNESVTAIIIRRVPVSMRVGIIPVLLGAVLGLIVGIIAALYKNTVVDYFATVLAVIGVSVPAFIVASLLQYYLSSEFGLLPTSFNSRGAGPIEVYIMPIIALSFGTFAAISRFTRTEMIEALSSDYVMLAKAKGASKMRIVFVHCLRNILIPIVTILPFSFLLVVMGSLVVEQIFSIPGMGGTMVEAIGSNDYPTILGTTVYYTGLILLTFIIVDILQVIVDPRIRTGGNQ